MGTKNNKENENTSVMSNFDIKKVFLHWEWFLILILIGIIIMNSYLSPNFLNMSTLFNAPLTFLDKGFLVLSMTFILLLGEIDISVGSIIALTGVTLGLSFDAGLSMPVAIILSLIVGGLSGFLNGYLVVKFPELPSMILTLGTLSFYRGLSYVLLENESVSGFPTWYQNLGWGSIGPIPIMTIFFFIAAILFIYLKHKTVYGREITSIGYNKRTSHFSGIEVDKRIISAFVLNGLMAAITMLFLTSRMSSIRADIATGYELEVIAMVVLGGVSTSGGIGSMYGPIISVFIIGFLSYGLGLVNVSSQAITMIIGILLIVSVLLTKINFKKK
jgi:rhamnose transport system permease protein